MSDALTVRKELDLARDTSRHLEVDFGAQVDKLRRKYPAFVIDPDGSPQIVLRAPPAAVNDQVTSGESTTVVNARAGQPIPRSKPSHGYGDDVPEAVVCILLRASKVAHGDGFNDGDRIGYKKATGPISPAMVHRHLRGEQAFTVFLNEPYGDETYLAVIDLDNKKKYEATLTDEQLDAKIDQLVQKSAARNLRPFACVSRSGTGRNLWYCWKSKQRNFDVEAELLQIINESGLALGTGAGVAAGQCELFVQCKNIGVALPCFAGHAADRPQFSDNVPMRPTAPKEKGGGRDVDDASDFELARDALKAVPADVGYDDWIKIGFALGDGFGDEGRALFEDWSKTGSTWNERKDGMKWDKLKPNGEVGLGTLFHIAKTHGWKHPGIQPDWKNPTDLWWEGLLLPKLERGILPPVLDDFCFGNLNEFDPGALSACALVACATAFSQTNRVEINGGFQLPALFWRAVTGDSSDAKSPTINQAWGPIRAWETEQFKIWRAKMDAWKALPDDESRGAAPVLVRSFTNDSTMEGLRKIQQHAENVHGITCMDQELSTWIRAMDGAYNERNTSARGHWLARWDAGPRLVDRFGEGGVRCENWGGSFIGGITTANIVKIASTLTPDGMLARFGIVQVQPVPGNTLDGLPYEVVRPYEQLIARLFRESRGATYYDGGLRARISDGAREVLLAYRRECNENAVLFKHDLPRYSERLGKTWSDAARVALLFAAIEDRMATVAEVESGEADVPLAEGWGGLITRDHMTRAVAYCRWGSAHDRIFYHRCAKQEDHPTMSLARKVGEWLLANRVSEFKAGDITSRVMDWRTAKEQDRFAVLQLMMDLRWTWTKGEFYAGGKLKAGIVWKVNPKVHDKYEGRAALVRARMAELKRQLEAAVASRREGA